MSQQGDPSKIMGIKIKREVSIMDLIAIATCFGTIAYVGWFQPASNNARLRALETVPPIPVRLSVIETRQNATDAQFALLRSDLGDIKESLRDISKRIDADHDRR